MNRRICDYVITIYISLLLFYIVGSNIGRLYDLYSTKELSIGLLYFGVFGLIMYIFNKIINKVRFDIYDLLTLVFLGESVPDIDFAHNEKEMLKAILLKERGNTTEK